MQSRIGFFCLIGGAGIALAALAGCGPRPNSQGAFTKAEARAALIYEANLHQGPEALRAFLVDFPKGADLHVHLSGAVYAETLIRDAAEDGACVDPVALTLAKPPCTGKLIPATKFTGNIDRATQLLYDKLIDSLSVRSFVPTDEWSEHDQFFKVFDRTGGLKDHTGEWVDEVATRAAAQNQQYLELMVTPPFSHATGIARDIGWSPALAQADPQAFAQFRQQLLDKGLRDEVAADREEVRAAEAQRKLLEHCGTPQAAPLARSRFATSGRCCATFRPSRFSRKLCWASRLRKPQSTREMTRGSASTSSGLKMITSPCATTPCR